MLPEDLKQIEYEGKKYAIVPAIVKGMCTYCVFDNDNICPHTKHIIYCGDNSTHPQKNDHILIRATPARIAKYVALRLERST